MRKPILKRVGLFYKCFYKLNKLQLGSKCDSFTFLFPFAGCLNVLQYYDFQECLLAFLRILSVSPSALGSKPKEAPFSWDMFFCFPVLSFCADIEQFYKWQQVIFLSEDKIFFLQNTLDPYYLTDLIPSTIYYIQS